MGRSQGILWALVLEMLGFNPNSASLVMTLEYWYLSHVMVVRLNQLTFARYARWCPGLRSTQWILVVIVTSSGENQVDQEWITCVETYLITLVVLTSFLQVAKIQDLLCFFTWILQRGRIEVCQPESLWHSSYKILFMWPAIQTRNQAFLLEFLVTWTAN